MDYVSVKKSLFGGEIEFVIYGVSDEIARDFVEEVQEEGLRLQKIFNFYDPKSELSFLNKNQGGKVSSELLEVIVSALKFCEIGGGKYDISLGKFILERKSGKESEISCSYQDVNVLENKIEFLNKSVMIDLGSIAKGYIADKLAEFLKSKGIEEFLIDARGDIRVVGNNEHIFGIQNPRGKGEIFSIKIKDESVATSGDYNQYEGSFDKSHIINQGNWASVTVVAPTLKEADVYATLFFTLNLLEIEKILMDNKSIKVLMVDQNNKIIKLNGFDSLIQK